MAKTKNKNTKEVRIFDANDLECRTLEDGKMVIEGYAVKFEVPATHGYTEIIDKNAFSGADLSDVIMKYNHEDSHLLIARTRNNSLRLTIDDIGLFVHAELLDTTSNLDVYKSVVAKLLDKFSFAFTVDKQEWDYETDTRRILKFDKIFDVSLVDIPFYDCTEVYARSLEVFEEEKRKYESLKLEKEKLKLLLDI